MEHLNKSHKTFSIKNAYVIICIFISSILSSLSLSYYLGLLFGFSFVGIIVVALYFPIKSYLTNNVLELTFEKFLVSIIGSIGISLTVYNIFTLNMYHTSFLVFFIFFVSFSSFLFPILLIFHSYIYRNKDKEEKAVFEKLIFDIPIFVCFLFLFFIQPITIFLNNVDDITVSIVDIIKSELFFLPILLCFFYIMWFLPDILYKIIGTVVASFNVSAYIQLLFFNKYIGLLIGGGYQWKNHIYHSFFNLLVWGFIFVISIFFLFSKKFNKIVIYLNIAIAIMLSVGLISLIPFVSKNNLDILKKETGNYYLNTDEQFTVGKENVIILIADAVDNTFIESILEDDPNYFDDFNDFTLYMDTCSVYDYTLYSTQQMLYGYTFKQGTEKTIPFMSRFIDNGYRILFYSYNGVSAPGNPSQFVANYTYSKEAIFIRKDMIRDNMWKITSHQLFPCILKQFSHIEKMDFEKCIDENSVTRDTLYENEEFNRNINLSLNTYSDKCFIYHHIRGAHFPSDDYIKDTKISLNAFKKYIYQLKELGVYDDSVIIIAADHGRHDGCDDVPFPTAATPMFMIKGKNESHDKINISYKSMYYTDFQPTIIDYAELNEDGDEELFGKSIDDYSDNEKRIRVWFDSDTTVYTGVRKYTYYGDTSELEKAVINDEYENVDDYSFDISEVLTD